MAASRSVGRGSKIFRRVQAALSMEFSSGSPVASERLVLDFGQAPNLRARMFLITGAFFCAIGLFWLVIWLLLRPHVSIPANTSVLVSVDPQTFLSALTEEQKNFLPPVWRVALEGKSGWPVVLGAYRDQVEWRTFAVLPRWQTGSAMVRETKGWVAVLSDHPLSGDRRPFGYLDQTDWWNAIGSAPLTGWMDPTRIMSVSTTNNLADRPFLFRLKGRELLTTLPFKPAGAAEPLAQADVSMDFSDPVVAPDLVALFFSHIGLNDILFREYGLEPGQFSLTMDDAWQLKEMKLVFRQPVTAAQGRAMLAAFGWADDSPVSLPDGTFMNEQTASPATSTLSVFGPHESARYGTVEIAERAIRIGAESGETGQKYEPSKACNGIIPWLRVSPRLSARLASQLFGSDVSAVPAVVIAQKNNKLEVCFE